MARRKMRRGLRQSCSAGRAARRNGGERLEPRWLLAGDPPAAVSDVYEILPDQVLVASSAARTPLVTELIDETFVGSSAPNWAPSAFYLGRFGPFSNETARLHLADLPAHSEVVLTLDLAILDSWDGEFDANRPDALSIVADGETLLNASFSNWPGYRSHHQSYPDAVGEGLHPAGTGANRQTPVSGAPLDETRYQLEFRFAHAADDLLIEFTGENLFRESWALEEAQVSVVQEQTPFPAGVLANDVDPEDDALIATLARPPEYGTVLFGEDGEFTYVPPSGFVGLDSFEYVASDGTSESATTLVEIHVTAPNQPPLAHMDEYAVAAGETLRTGDGESDPATVVFEDDIGVEPSLNWSRRDTTTTPGGGRRILGLFSEDAVDLTLEELPPHQLLEVEFDLIVAMTWDGDEPFRFLLDDELLLETSFHSPGGATQAYPGTLGVDVNFAGTGASESRSLGYTFGGDNVYRVKFTVPHTSTRAVFQTSVSRTEGVDNEAWGLDNVVVRAYGSVLANDDDPEGDALAAELVEGPHNGSVEFFSNGQFIYQPTAGFVGIDVFRYVARDGQGISVSTPVVINVLPSAAAAATIQPQIPVVDAAYFAASFGRSTEAEPGLTAWDSDGDGVIGLGDFAAFKSRGWFSGGF